MSGQLKMRNNLPRTHKSHAEMRKPFVMISSCYDLSDNCFSFTSTLADTMRSMDVSRSPDSLTLYSPFPISRATSSCTRTFPFLFHVFSYLYQYGLSTRLLTSLAYACLLLFCQLVSLRLLLTLVSFCFIDSSLAYLLRTVDSSVVRHSSHFPFLYICNCTRSPLYIRVGDGDYSPSSIYFATTLKV